jgi:cobalt-precorrin-5B (C1)-methyltransferase
LLTGREIDEVTIDTPKGIRLTLDVEELTRTEEEVACAIKKDAGDDADVTHGILIFATVKKARQGILIDGGTGVGRVTKQGLDQPVGAAAINRVPRQMIETEVLKVCDEEDYEGGLEVIISIPEGEALAKKTFNPRLGITGGISILGTSGIVEPMSEAALVETIRAEMRMLSLGGKKYLAATPGNYGEAYAGSTLKLQGEYTVKCSNFVGETIDMAYECNLDGLLLVGHIGKFVKLAGGIMNTHSKFADCRLELLCTCCLLAGGEQNLLEQVLASVTTDEALDMIKNAGILSKTMDILMEKIEYHIKHRAYEGLKIGAVVFSNAHGFLGQTKEALFLIEKLK